MDKTIDEWGGLGSRMDGWMNGTMGQGDRGKVGWQGNGIMAVTQGRARAVMNMASEKALLAVAD